MKKHVYMNIGVKGPRIQGFEGSMFKNEDGYYGLKSIPREDGWSVHEVLLKRFMNEYKKVVPGAAHYEYSIAPVKLMSDEEFNSIVEQIQLEDTVCKITT